VAGKLAGQVFDAFQARFGDGDDADNTSRSA